MGLNAAAVVVSLVLVVGLIGSSCVAQAPSKAPAPSHKHSKLSPASPPVREKTPPKGSTPVPSPSVSNSHGAPAPESGAPTASSLAPGASPTGESPAEGPSTGGRGVSAGATAKLEKMAIVGAALVGGAAFLL